MGLFSNNYDKEAKEFFDKVNPNEVDKFVGFVRLERMTLGGAIGRGLGGALIALTMKIDILVFYQDQFLIVYNEDFKGKNPPLKIPFDKIEEYNLSVKKVGIFNPKRYEFEWKDGENKFKGWVAGSKKDGNSNRLGPQLIEITERIIPIK